MQYLPEFLIVAGIHLLAVMSPGPDFALISRNSFVYSRKVGTMSAFGLALGILVHVTYSLVGIGFLIAKSIVLFSIIKYIGAAYLLYIGYKSLRAKPMQSSTDQAKIDELNPAGAIKMGFLTNVLNPKVSLFFLAIFSQVIHVTTPTMVKIAYGLEMSAVTFVWFSLVAAFFSLQTIKTKFGRIQHHVEHVFGALLILLGIKVALSAR